MAPMPLPSAASVKEFTIVLDCRNGKLNHGQGIAACTASRTEAGQHKFFVRLTELDDAHKILATKCRVQLRLGDYVVPQSNTVSVQVFSAGSANDRVAHSWSE
jgi:hypothetical protein